MGEVGLMVGVDAVARGSRPKSVIIEGDFFGINMPENHTAGATIANREGFYPGLGRLAIPQTVLVHH